MTPDAEDDEDANVLSLRIPASLDGERLDKALAALAGEALSRARVQALIEAGAVSLDARAVTDRSGSVKAGESYDIALPAPAAALPQAQAIPLDIVFEDAHVIVVNKPAGMVVHPAAGNTDGTLVNALLHHCAGQLSGINGEARPGIVHRIDKDTSGLLVCAKTDRSLRSLGKQFAAHAIERLYIAYAWGAPFKAEGTIETGIGRSHIERTKMIVRDAEKEGARNAITHYRVTERFGPAFSPAASRIECRLETGRTHQIRVHMTHIGCPLIGDRTYGRPRTAAAAKRALGAEAAAALEAFPRQALHAATLGFQHPETHKTLTFRRDPPPDMAALARALARVSG